MKRHKTIGAAGLLAVALGSVSTPGQIRILIDVHADPLPCGAGCTETTVSCATYLDWLPYTRYALDQATLRGAHISFLTGGDFAEWVLEPPGSWCIPAGGNPGRPLLRDLYLSGLQIGTHSHTEMRTGAHVWSPLASAEPTLAEIEAHWSDHVSQVDAVAALLFPALPVRTVNTSRGSGLPGRYDHDVRRDLMDTYGFPIQQQGLEQEFYALFKHYAMNPWRPTEDGILRGYVGAAPRPPALIPTGSVLGKDEEHLEIMQYNSIEYVQARFLFELLNWLHDVHVAHTERIWTFGWGSHSSDYQPGKATRTELPLILDWLSTHFVGMPAGGVVAAEYDTFVGVRADFEAWEAAHPGATSFDYPSDVQDWSVYPYLVPPAAYFTQPSEARYVEAMPPVGTVRWHRVRAYAAPGVPDFDFYVAYTTDGVPVLADLSAHLPAGLSIATVDTVTGDTVPRAKIAVPIPAKGTILVGTGDALVFCDGPTDPDFPELGDPCTVGVGGCARTGMRVCTADKRGTTCDAVPAPPTPESCADGVDNDCDGITDEPSAASADLVLTVTDTTLSWSPADPAVWAYDVVFGGLGVLRASGGDFTAATFGCHVDDTTATTVPAPPGPAPGQGLWLLVRGNGCLADGAWSSDPGVDGMIEASPAVCP